MHEPDLERELVGGFALAVTVALCAILLVPAGLCVYLIATVPMRLPGVVLLLAIAAVSVGLVVAELRQAFRSGEGWRS